MSKKHHEVKCCEYKEQGLFGFGGKDNCICSFPTLIILILIILQFSRRGHGEHKQIDNGILFIIALFYLTCANPCKK